jgi:outer membrane protein insertion porin family
MRLPLSENPTVYALAFAEVGNVWDDFDNVDPFQFKRSAGIGVRMFMPMLGMIGFDMGYGFDDTIFDSDNKPQGWDYHILFGMPF